MYVRPEVLTLANYTDLSPLKAEIDKIRYLLASWVHDAFVDKGTSSTTPDGGWDDDPGTDETLGISVEDG
jgi:hypothetical protein